MKGRAVLGGEFGASHCNQWGLCCVVVQQRPALPKLLWGRTCRILKYIDSVYQNSYPIPSWGNFANFNKTYQVVFFQGQELKFHSGIFNSNGRGRTLEICRPIHRVNETTAITRTDSQSCQIIQSYSPGGANSRRTGDLTLVRVPSSVVE